ncbi:DUF3558 family protein [Saccharomonospora sp. NB11]|uniref:DUF3558 family protein n=1 Tax=Saccharomonospora sp. NB11 TaxID=1642298 RepID=UPI0018D0FB7A|nr:DUF3558 family protein [Saccharomonospora sp. NB11]
MCARRRGAIVLPLLSLLFLVGCADTEPGSASPTGHSEDMNTPTGESSPGGSREGSSLEQMDPCSLLDGAELNRFGEFGPGEYRDYGTGRNCRWQADRDGASEKVPLVDLIIEDEAGVDVLPDLGGGLQTGKAGSGRSIVRTSNEDGCVVAMAVGESARVDVIVSMVELDSACSITDELVDIIDEKLPLG